MPITEINEKYEVKLLEPNYKEIAECLNAMTNLHKEMVDKDIADKIASRMFLIPIHFMNKSDLDITFKEYEKEA